MADFAFKNSKNDCTDHTMFELNCGHYLWIFFKDKCNIHFESSSVNGLDIKQKELMNIYHQNLLYTQDLQKQAYDKGVKPWSYAPSEKIGFNSKHIKMYQKQELEAKFFALF